MRLIFNEEIDFLKRELGINVPSNTAWMDRMNIKVVDENNKWYIIYKIKAENMKIVLKKDNSETIKDITLKTWNDLVLENKEELEKIETDIIDNIIYKYICEYKDNTIAIPVSGGKDSAVVYDLVTRCIKKYNMQNKIKVIFSNTSNENHVTYKYIKDNYPMAKILSPKVGFYQLIKQYGTIPNRVNRFCCSLLKEKIMIDELKEQDNILYFMGMRREESAKRSEYETEWRNIRWTNETWLGILPILDLTEYQIWLMMLKNDIPINKNYIGTARVGCQFCPYRSDYELIVSKEFYPKYYDRWEKVLTDDFIDNKKSPSINCSLSEYLNGAWKAGMVRDEATKEIIEEFAESMKLEYKVAEKYFDKKCSCCDKKLKKDDIALSMKYYGRQIEKFKCIKHLGEDFSKSSKDMKLQIKEFKEQGCSLF